MALSVLAFISAFYVPLWAAIIGWGFGGMNILIDLGLIEEAVKGWLNKKKEEDKDEKD